jgi:transcriptional regulator with XRE-family HTH domain
MCNITYMIILCSITNVCQTEQFLIVLYSNTNMSESDQKRFYELLGERIKDARTGAKLKQETFATYLKLSRSSIVNIEKGRQHPQIHLLWDIAKILNIEVSELFPEMPSAEKISPEWTRIIAQSSVGNKRTKEKLLSFLEEVKSSKPT